jgi:homoserine O-acetyltransferase/O-succinyltransferase
LSEPASTATRLLELPGEFPLENGDSLREVAVAYRTWGEPRPVATLVCHALTGNADADQWWPGLFGPNQTLDPDRDFIVSTNVLGGCYGTTGPTSPRPGHEGWYGPAFPDVTIRDMVRLQARLLEQLGVDRLKLVIGGSMGGMQALEWAVMFPGQVDAVVSIGAGPTHSAWGIAFSETQRAAITSDPDFELGGYAPGAGPVNGLSTARMIAMVSYRGRESFESRFGRRTSEDDFAVQSYLKYQGSKLVERFDANTYLTLVGAMDSHDLSRGRGDIAKVLASVQTPVLAIGISSDILYPALEVQDLARGLPNSQYETLHAPHGHDSFLIEMESLNRIATRFTAGLAAGVTPASAQSLAAARGAAWA